MIKAHKCDMLKVTKNPYQGLDLKFMKSLGFVKVSSK